MLCRHRKPTHKQLLNTNVKFRRKIYGLGLHHKIKRKNHLKLVAISSRVCPGERPGVLMLLLTTQYPEARKLRKAMKVEKEHQEDIKRVDSFRSQKPRESSCFQAEAKCHSISVCYLMVTCDLSPGMFC